jgi:hypothetical protein
LDNFETKAVRFPCCSGRYAPPPLGGVFMPSERGGRGAGERFSVFPPPCLQKGMASAFTLSARELHARRDGLYSAAGHPCWGSVHKCIFRSHHFSESGDLPRQSLSRPRGRLHEVLCTNAKKSRVPDTCWGQILCDAECRHRRCVRALCG